MSADPRDHRDACPKHIARCDVTGVNPGIECQIGESCARHVFRFRDATRKDEAVFRNTTCGGFAAQVVLGEGVILQEPQNTAVDVPHDRAPGVKDVGRNFESLVEGAVDDRVFRQVMIGAARFGLRDRLRVVGNQIAMRQICGGFAVIVRAVDRRHCPVGEHIVYVVGAVGTGKADIGDLDRCGTKRHDFEAVSSNLATQIDENVDPVVDNSLCGRFVADLAQVHEVIGRCQDSLAKSAFIVVAVGIGGDLEARPVVMIEKTGDEMPDCVIAEIRRKVTEPNGSRVAGRASMGERLCIPAGDFPSDSLGVESRHGEIPRSVFDAGNVNK